MNAKKGQETDLRLKIIVIGDAGIGKTCMAKRYVEGTYYEGDKTPAYSMLDVSVKKIYSKEREVRLEIWDTNGTEKFYAYTAQFLRDAHGAVITYAVNRRSSFDNLIKHIRRLEELYDPHNFPVLCIVGTMTDDIENRRVGPQEARQWAERQLKSCKWVSIEVSAKTNFRVNDAFYYLVDKILDTPHLWFRERDRMSIVPFDARNLKSKDKTTCKCS